MHLLYLFLYIVVVGNRRHSRSRRSSWWKGWQRRFWTDWQKRPKGWSWWQRWTRRTWIRCPMSIRLRRSTITRLWMETTKGNFRIHILLFNISNKLLTLLLTSVFFYLLFTLIQLHHAQIKGTRNSTCYTQRLFTWRNWPRSRRGLWTRRRWSGSRWWIRWLPR